MTKLLIILCLTLIATPAIAEDWDTTDKALAGLLLASMFTDCRQTQYIFDHPEEYHELNPVIVDGVKQHGKGFVPFYFAVSALTSLYIADKLPSKWRKIGLSFFAGASMATIKWNYLVGIRLGF